MKTYVIGDVHGCIDELINLLWEIYVIEGHSQLRFVYIGDLIDKGPDSIAALEEAMAYIGKRHPTDESVILMGNHEDKFQRWLGHEYRRGIFPDYKNPILKKPEWNIPLINLGNTGKIKQLPLWYKIPETGHICIHAGIPLNMKELPDPDWEKASRKDKTLLFCRYVNQEGGVIPLGQEGPDDPFWADVYDGRFGPAIYGHQAYKEVKIHKHAIGIDTGVVYGNKLTAYCPNTEIIIQVNANRAYAEPYSSEGLK